MKTFVSAFAAASMLSACATVSQPPDAQDQFMATLKSMCGQRFEGALSYAAEARNDFAGHKISTQVVCSDREVRMPVQVGTDRSRTWVFTRPAGGLELRHDHRHADGTPDAITMYGGMAQEGGSARRQAFLADAYTARMVPGAETNVWTVSFSDDGQMLTYHLARHARPRAEFVLRRVGDGPSFDARRMSQDVKVLASDEFEGRAPYTAGETKTVNYLVEQFKAAGLQPGGDLIDGKRSWTQEVPLRRFEIKGPAVLSVIMAGRRRH